MRVHLAKGFAEVLNARPEVATGVVALARLHLHLDVRFDEGVQHAGVRGVLCNHLCFEVRLNTIQIVFVRLVVLARLLVNHHSGFQALLALHLFGVAVLLNPFLLILRGERGVHI